MRRLILVGACLLATALGPRRVDRPFAPAATSVQPSLIDLHSVDELRTLFNRDVGTVRLVLLVSPT